MIQCLNEEEYLTHEIQREYNHGSQSKVKRHVETQVEGTSRRKMCQTGWKVSSGN